MPDDKKPDYFDGIRDHFTGLETQTIEVPEWGLVGDKAIYCRRIRFLWKRFLLSISKQFDYRV